MTSSDLSVHERAASVIREMSVLLDEDYIARTIDEPINRAAAEFAFRDEEPFCRLRFHETVARFVAYIYARGLPCRRSLSASQAHDEAIALLEHAYQGAREQGYLAAVRDAQAQPGGVEVVLARLAEIMKATRRHNHVEWVFARYLDPLDWELRCAVVEILLQPYRLCDPDPIASASSSDFVDDIPVLLKYHFDTDRMLRNPRVGFPGSAA